MMRWYVRLAGALTVLAGCPMVAALGHAQHAERSRIEAFVEEFVPPALERLRIPGAVVAVVRPGSPPLLLGYGVADLESGMPMKPDQTLVRVASISKLVTATAALQLSEQGVLDLDADIERYVESPVSRRFPDVLTPHHLLTHTSGFEDRGIGVAVRQAPFPLGLGAYVARRMPFQAARPGQLLIYTDHGYCLLGHVIEKASGTSFEEVIKKRIFTPARMRNSSFWHTSLDVEALAVGYLSRSGRLVPVEYGEFVNLPSSQLVTTAEDMARFMLAHLSVDESGHPRLLEAATLRKMHSRQFSNDPEVVGFGYGFWERLENGHRIIMHDGGILGFSSALLLLPTADLGIFIAYNRLEPRLHEEFTIHFMDTFFPSSEPSGLEHGAPIQVSKDDPSGWYVMVRPDRTRLEHLFALVSAFRVERSGPSSVVIAKGTGEWTQTGPSAFARHQDGARLALGRDISGRVAYLYTDRLDGTPLSYRRLNWRQSPPFQLAILSASLSFLLFTLIAVPVMWFTRGREAVRAKFGSPSIAVLAWLPATLSVGFILVCAWLLSGAMKDGGWEFVYGIPTPVRLALYAPGGAAGLGALLVGAVVARGARGDYQRVWWPLGVGLSIGAVLFLLLEWNVLPPCGAGA